MQGLYRSFGKFYWLYLKEDDFIYKTLGSLKCKDTVQVQ